MLAQNFQEMYLKVILDRLKFVPESVSLGKSNTSESSSLTFYLLLPVLLHDSDKKITVDWKIIRRCLSSPIFRTPEDAVEKENFPLGDNLLLANGCRSISEVKDSLVYAEHKKKQGFFFITGIVDGKNGYSPHSETSSYAEHLYDKYATRLLDTIPFWIAFETHVMPNFCLLKGNLIIYNELKKHNNKYLSFIYVYKIYCNFCCFSFINLLNHFFLYVGSQVSRSTQIP